MPVGVSSQWNRIWNMEWNNATVQTGVIIHNNYDTWLYTIVEIGKFLLSRFIKA